MSKKKVQPLPNTYARSNNIQNISLPIPNTTEDENKPWQTPKKHTNTNALGIKQTRPGILGSPIL